LLAIERVNVLIPDLLLLRFEMFLLDKEVSFIFILFLFKVKLLFFNVLPISFSSDQFH